MLEFASRRVLALACGLALAALALAAQKPVSIYVSVTRGQHIIRGLAAGNFRLLVAGQPVPFQLEPPERPISVALLAEYSRFSAPYLGDIAAALHAFIADAPEGDWYALATFANKMSVAEDFTKLKGKIPAAFAALGPPQHADISTHDAVHDMLDKMARLPGRRVLVLIGSGLDTFGAHTLGDVRAQLAASNVTVFCIGTGQALRLKNPRAAGTSFAQADALLRALAKESGGEAWFPRFPAAFPEAAGALLQALDHQYRLVFTPPPADRARSAKLRVEAFADVAGQRQTYTVLARPTLPAP